MSDESVNHGTKIMLEACASKKDTKSPGMIDSGLGKQLGVIEPTNTEQLRVLQIHQHRCMHIAPQIGRLLNCKIFAVQFFRFSSASLPLF